MDITGEDGGGSRAVVRLTIAMGVAAAVTLCVAAVPILVGAERIVAIIGGWVTGYEVEVNGSASLRFWGTPGVDADDIVIRLPRERFVPVDSPPVMRIARLEADLSLWSLARGTVHARRLVLVRPSLRFDRGSDGADNWSIRGKPRLDGEPPFPGQPAISMAGFPGGEISALTVEGGAFRFTDARLDRDLTLDAISLDAGTTRGSEGKVLRLRGDARLKGEPIYIETELRRLGDFRDGIRVPFQVMVDAAPGSLLMRGTVAHRGRWAASAAIDLDVDDPGALTVIWPPLPKKLIGQASARMQVDVKGGRVEAAIRSLIFGSSDFAGRISADLDDKVPLVDLDLEAGALDLRHMAAAARIAGLIDPTSAGKVRRYAVGGRGRIKWARLLAPGMEFGGGAMGLSWRPGEPNLALDVGSLPLFGGTVSARAEATANEGKTALSLSASVSDIDAALMTAGLSGGHGLAGRLHGNVEVLAVGGSGPEMLRAVSGSGRMALSEGKVFGSALQKAVDKNKRSIALGRASMDFTVEGGVVASDELLLDFEVGHTRAGLTWDMPSGEVTVGFRPSPLHEGAPPVVTGHIWDVLLAR